SRRSPLLHVAAGLAHLARFFRDGVAFPNYFSCSCIQRREAPAKLAALIAGRRSEYLLTGRYRHVQSAFIERRCAGNQSAGIAFDARLPDQLAGSSVQGIRRAALVAEESGPARSRAADA